MRNSKSFGFQSKPFITSSVVYGPETVKVDVCDGVASTETATNAIISFANKDSKVMLGTTKGDVKILSVRTTESTFSKTDLCRRDETDGKTGEYYEIKSEKIKAILYKVENSYKILLVGSDVNSKITPYMISEEEKNLKFVQIHDFKCLPVSELTTFKTKYTAAPYPYIEHDTNLCFVSYMMSQPIEVTSSASSSAYTIIVSPSPKKSCPQCPESPSIPCSKSG